jgi:hypothetical protein
MKWWQRRKSVNALYYWTIVVLLLTNTTFGIVNYLLRDAGDYQGWGVGGCAINEYCVVDDGDLVLIVRSNPTSVEPVGSY